VIEPGREMGSDSSPKKWNLKEQRNTYLQWFSLADEGLLRDPSRPVSNYFALSCGSMNAAESDWRCYGCAIEDGDGRLTGNDALKFFAMSNLSKPELKQVSWRIQYA